MASKSYRKGYRFEKEVQAWFEREGFLVIRQGKSKFPDLIAIPPRNARFAPVRLIECKYNKKPSKRELLKLKELEEKYHAWAFVAMKRKGQRGFDFYVPDELLEEEDEECPTS